MTQIKLAKALAYVTSFTNCCSCMILFLTIRHAYKIAQKLNEVHREVDSQLKLNGVVTLMHIAVILGSSVLGFLIHTTKMYGGTTFIKAGTSWVALTALQGIYLAYNMFFILDEERRPDLIRDEGRKVTYPLLEVVKKQRFSVSVVEDTSSSSSDESSF